MATFSGSSSSTSSSSSSTSDSSSSTSDSSSTAPYKPSTSSAICANDDNIPADVTASSTDSSTMSLLAVLGKLLAPKPSELSSELILKSIIAIF